ncbi:MAG: SRPBCC domain-containing protein [Ignavibacteria bacterium]|nr:SRPBCC domain-containing protein [Ignavibacteria bacterium]
MAKNYTLSLSHEYQVSPEKVYEKIQDGTIFKLAGCDDLLHEFAVDAPVAMFFNDRGQIFGTYKEIVKNKKVVLDWNVTGFDKPEELNTRLQITLSPKEKNKTSLSLTNSEIKNEASYEAKKKAWEEILDDLEKEF